MNFPQYIAYLSTGLVKPIKVQRRIHSYYAERIELSRCKDLQPVHSGAVNDLDIDHAEHR